MISYIYDIRHDNDHDNAHDIITHPPAMSAGKSQSFGWGIMKDFNVSIPSSIGELGRCLAAEVWRVPYSAGVPPAAMSRSGDDT